MQKLKPYEKYIYANLGYYNKGPHSLLMTHISNEKGHICDHCGKVIKGNVYHFDEYDHENYGKEYTDKKWTFDYKCMPYVVGVGLK